MAKINVESGGTILSTGLLQLSGGSAMSTTLTTVTDQNNTASQLKLATNLTQVAGTLQIALNGGTYIDAQDVSGIDRFNVNRSAGSQQVNVDFSSNPTSGTDAVGALRTYANGVVLSEAMTFLRNGNVGVGTNTPTQKLEVNGNGKFGNTIIRSDAFLLGTGGGSAFSIYGDQTLFRPVMSFYPTGNNVNIDGLLGVGLASSTTVPSARTHIKGSGSTSATTSLLVQNSAASNLLSVLDDGRLTNFGDFYLGSGSAGGSSVFQNAGNTLNLSADNNHDVGYTQIKARRTAAGGGVRIENTNFPSNPDNSAQLDVASTTKGFLPPRMTNAQRLAIVTPAVGLMVYCTDAVEGLYVYKSTGWTFVI